MYCGLCACNSIKSRVSWCKDNKVKVYAITSPDVMNRTYVKFPAYGLRMFTCEAGHKTTILVDDVPGAEETSSGGAIIYG